MEINIGTWNMYFWQKRYGNYPKTDDEKKQWGIKSINILNNILRNTDFILLQEINPFFLMNYYQKLMFIIINIQLKRNQNNIYQIIQEIFQIIFGFLILLMDFQMILLKF